MLLVFCERILTYVPKQLGRPPVIPTITFPATEWFFRGLHALQSGSIHSETNGTPPSHESRKGRQPFCAWRNFGILFRRNVVKPLESPRSCIRSGDEPFQLGRRPRHVIAIPRPEPKPASTPAPAPTLQCQLDPPSIPHPCLHVHSSSSHSPL